MFCMSWPAYLDPNPINFAAALLLTLAAIALVIWQVKRRQRAFFVESLSTEDRARLQGFKKLMSWREFRRLTELERQRAKVTRPALHDIGDKVEEEPGPQAGNKGP
jgi:hypothetical protein